MAKQCLLVLLICSLAIAMPMANGITHESPQEVEKWFKNLPSMKEKTTKLHFYFHDKVTSPNPSAIQIAEAQSTNKSSTFFGLTMVADDPLTVGPDPNSKIIGRAQGIYSGASQGEVLGLLMSMNFVFTEGRFNGSTLSLHGRNSILQKYREMPIVGGSGVFRLARGIATAKTFSLQKSGDAVVEYHVIVIHY